MARQSGTPDLEKEEVIPRRRSARLLAKARAEAATASSYSSNPVGNSYSFPAERGTSAPFYPKVPNGESRHTAEAKAPLTNTVNVSNVSEKRPFGSEEMSEGKPSCSKKE